MDASGKRTFETIPLNEVIDRLKKRMSPVPEVNCAGSRLLFHLSPNDLVYVPVREELLMNQVDKYKYEQVYKIVSFTNKRLYAIPYSVSNVIVDKLEYGALNKIEFTKEKDICIPLKVDRLGNIKHMGTEFLPKKECDE